MKYVIPVVAIAAVALIGGCKNNKQQPAASSPPPADIVPTPEPYIPPVAPAPVVTTPPPVNEPGQPVGMGGTYVVQKGDTISKIARARYGDLKMVRAIIAANPQLTDPNKLTPGMTLTLP